LPTAFKEKKNEEVKKMFTSLDQKDSESKVKTFDNGHAMPWESDCCKKVMSCVSRFICFVGLSISLGKSECERDNSLLLSSRITECGEVFKIKKNRPVYTGLLYEGIKKKK
jgi:hypothetical protein